MKVYFTQFLIQGIMINVHEGISVVVPETGESTKQPIWPFHLFVSCAHPELTGDFTIAASNTIYGYSMHRTAARNSSTENQDPMKCVGSRNQHSEMAVDQSLWFNTGVHVAISKCLCNSFYRRRSEIYHWSRASLPVQEYVCERFWKGIHWDQLTNPLLQGRIYKNGKVS